MDHRKQMRIFDDIGRNDLTPRRNAEASWSFLNRSATPAAERVRVLLENLLSEYPDQHADELVARLRSDDFEAAYFELLLHAVILRHGATIQVHAAEASGNDRRPDFLAAFPSGQKVIFEAVTCKDISAVDEATEAEWDRLYDQINSLQTDFLIATGVLPSTPADNPPPARRVLPFLARELANLDAQTERDRLEADQARYAASLPTSLFCDEGITLEFQFIPRTESRRGTSEAIGIYPMKSRWGTSSRAMATGVGDKATRYGEVQFPYVIVVNSLSPWGYGVEDEVDALFGSSRREVTGALLRTDGVPQNTRVSGVVIGTVWLELARARMRLYDNPYARRPLDGIPWRLDRMRGGASDNELEEGEGIREILEISSEWPHWRFE